MICLVTEIDASRQSRLHLQGVDSAFLSPYWTASPDVISPTPQNLRFNISLSYSGGSFPSEKSSPRAVPRAPAR